MSLPPQQPPGGPQYQGPPAGQQQYSQPGPAGAPQNQDLPTPPSGFPRPGYPPGYGQPAPAAPKTGLLAAVGLLALVLACFSGTTVALGIADLMEEHRYDMLVIGTSALAAATLLLVVGACLLFLRQRAGQVLVAMGAVVVLVLVLLDRMVVLTSLPLIFQ